MSGFPPKVRRAIEERSGGVCEGCGQRPATEMHHRQYRSRGGKDTVENGYHLCGWGNHTGCHGTAHSAEGHELGWSVNSWGDPALIPVLWRGGMAWLTPDGRVEPAGLEPSF